MVKQLNKKQAKELPKGKLPDDWWNYGINPIAGYRIPPAYLSRKTVNNSLPVPNSLKQK